MGCIVLQKYCHNWEYDFRCVHTQVMFLYTQSRFAPVWLMKFCYKLSNKSLHLGSWKFDIEKFYVLCKTFVIVCSFVSLVKHAMFVERQMLFSYNILPVTFISAKFVAL